MNDAPKVETSTTSEVLRAELMKLVKEGDPKKGGALTPTILLRIMKVAKTGRDLLTSLDMSTSNLKNLMRRPRFGSPLMIEDDLGDEELGVGGVGQALPFAGAPPMENFGMTAMRELISIAKNFNGPSPAKLVEALAMAKEKGLDDVAKQLEDQLKDATNKPSGVKAPASIEPPPVPPTSIIA